MKTKKISLAVVRTIFVLFVPAIFVAILIIALNQTFAIGLVMIIASLIIQSILSYKSKVEFAWGEYKRFSYHGYGLTNGQGFEKSLNILFNVVKVLTVLGIPRLIYLNFSQSLNAFGGLGITIFICLAIIFILLLSFNRHIHNYEVARGSWAINIGLTIITFSYLCFGTQLIWIPVVLAVIFGLLLGGFSEVEKLTKKDGLITILLPILLALTAIISTIIQFWASIASFFATIAVAIWSFIVKVVTYNVMGTSLGFIILILFVLAAIVFIGRWQGKRDRARREANRIREEQKALAEKEKKRREEKKAASDEADRVYKEETLKTISSLTVTLKEQKAKINEITFLSCVPTEFGFNYLQEFSIEALTGVELKDFLEVSDIKKQIVWQQSFSNVLLMYGIMYGKNYEDDKLKLIIDRFQELVSYLSNYTEYGGYSVIKNQISEPKIPVKWE